MTGGNSGSGTIRGLGGGSGAGLGGLPAMCPAGRNGLRDSLILLNMG